MSMIVGPEHAPERFEQTAENAREDIPGRTASAGAELVCPEILPSFCARVEWRHAVLPPGTDDRDDPGPACYRSALVVSRRHRDVCVVHHQHTGDRGIGKVLVQGQSRLKVNSMKRTPVIIAVVLLLLPVLYVGSYLVLLQRIALPVSVLSGRPVPIMNVAAYRIGGQYAKAFFWPLEQIDRRLRPGAWESSSRNPPSSRELMAPDQASHRN
jgi:hypothetical protein